MCRLCQAWSVTGRNLSTKKYNISKNEAKLHGGSTKITAVDSFDHDRPSSPGPAKRRSGSCLFGAVSLGARWWKRKENQALWSSPTILPNWNRNLHENNRYSVILKWCVQPSLSMKQNINQNFFHPSFYYGTINFFYSDENRRSLGNFRFSVSS